jgi:glycosyltransferase involved in cell wall biosynthesis
MKIVHFCPIYIDNLGYQENLLPFYFKKMGHEVCVITPNKLPANFNKTINPNKKYYLDGVEIRRIDVFLYVSFTLFATRKLYKNLKDLKPEMLFHHNIDFFSLMICVFYKSKHPECKLFVDNHADMINKTKSSIWFAFYYKFILRIVTKLSSPFVEKFYGVTLGRCDFLEQVFGVNSSKIKLLPIGADTISADKIKADKPELRKKFNITPTDFIIISGGKMGTDKGTDILIAAINHLNKIYPSIKLLLFGQYNDQITLDAIEKSTCVIKFDWCDRIQTLELLKLADISVWPIHHTTLIEDSIACLTPVILRKTRTTEHLLCDDDIYLNECNVDTIIEAIVTIFSDKTGKYFDNTSFIRNNIDYNKIVDEIISDYNNCLE